MTAPKRATAAIFHVPPPARPLLKAAHHFAGEVLGNPRQRLFTAPLTRTEIVLAAAANSRITVPDPLSDLTATWQIRVTCEPVDAPAPHTYSCARPDWTMLADTMGRNGNRMRGQFVRGEYPRAAEGDDRSFGRRPLTTDSAAEALQLIVDHFAGVPAVQRSTRNTARSWQLIRRDLAFYPRDSAGNTVGGLEPHPDLLFALRLVTNPPEMALPTRPFAVHRDQ